VSPSSDNRSGRALPRWPLFLIAAPAAVAVWSGWVGLGQLAGFGLVRPLPGILAWHLDTAITLPVGVEAYGAYALGAWLAPGGISAKARSFARRSAVGSLALGMLGQVAFHLLAAAHAVRAPWPVTVLVACMPVCTLGLGVALTHLLRGEDSPAIAEPESTGTVTASSRPPIALAWPVREPRPAALVALPRQRTRSGSRKRRRSAPVTIEDAALRYADEIADGRIPSMRRVKADLRVGQAKAQAIVAHLGALAEATAA
jgi:hypothetical protein